MLILEVQEKKIPLKFPYGRQPLPRPEAILEEDHDNPDFGVDVDADTDEATDDVGDPFASYRYEYGFNPLTFLGMAIKRAHPTRVAVREEALQTLRRRAENVIAREEALESLQKRGAHALARDEACQSLRLLSQRTLAGIALGPVIFSISETACLVWTQLASPGIFQFSLTSVGDEAASPRHMTQNAGNDCQCTLLLDSLLPGVEYQYTANAVQDPADEERAAALSGSLHVPPDSAALVHVGDLEQQMGDSSSSQTVLKIRSAATSPSPFNMLLLEHDGTSKEQSELEGLIARFMSSLVLGGVSIHRISC